MQNNLLIKKAPLRSIRDYCLWCMNEKPSEIKLDPAEGCPLFKLRFGKKSKGLSVLRQIKLRCKDCGENVRKCDSEDCPLFPYRFGRNPARAGIGGKGGVMPGKVAVSSGFLSKTGELKGI